MDIRFVGQEHTLTVPVPTPQGVVADDPAPVAELFLDDYERTFGSILDEQLEIVCVRAISTTPLEREAVSGMTNGSNGSMAGTQGTTQAWSFTAGEMTDFAVVDRSTLSRGDEVEGPAIVREQTTTTYVDRGYRASVGEMGALMIARGGDV
jgi:N-methylhydantoinase A